MIDDKIWKELEDISEQVELLENIDSENKKFLENSFKKPKIKIYKNGALPYEMSDKYLEGKKD